MSEIRIKALPPSDEDNWQACFIYDKHLRESVASRAKSYETYVKLSVSKYSNAQLICRYCSFGLTDDLPLIRADFKIWQLVDCSTALQPSDVFREQQISTEFRLAKLIDRCEDQGLSTVAAITKSEVQTFDVQNAKLIRVCVILTSFRSTDKQPSESLKTRDFRVLDCVKAVMSCRLLGVSSRTLIDCRECFIAKCGMSMPPISYLYIEDCFFDEGFDVNSVIGRVTVETEVEIVNIRDVGYYKRLYLCKQPTLVTAVGCDVVMDTMKGIWERQGTKSTSFNQFSSGLLVAATSNGSAKMIVSESAKRLCANVLEFSFLSVPLAVIQAACKAVSGIFSEGTSSAETCSTIVVLEDLEVLSTNPAKSQNSSTLELSKSKLVAHLCDCFDALPSNTALVVTAISSRPHLIPGRLRRPGRLQKEIYLPLPKQVERLKILQSRTYGVPEFETCDLEDIALKTPGYDMADLERLVSSILLKAKEENSSEVKNSDVRLSLSRVLPSVLQGSIGLVDLQRESSLDDIVGLSSVKLDLIKAIVWPLKHPEAFVRIGIQPPKGILLYGPPGCAKTTLVRAVAGSHHVNFLSVSAAELYSSGVGDSEKIIADLFHRARLASPCVLFIDELEAIVGTREGSSGSRKSNESILSTFLTEIDGIGVKSSVADNKLMKESFLDTPRVVLVAATNRPDLIDSALLRPGRFDRLIPVPPPEESERYEILKKCTSNTPLNPEVNLMQIANETKNYSGADLVNLCNEAALLALEEDMNIQSVSMKHLMKSKAQSTPSISTASLNAFREYCSFSSHTPDFNSKSDSTRGKDEDEDPGRKAKGDLSSDLPQA